MEIARDAYVVIVVVLLFGASVFVHEFGHFWVALRRGLTVEGFSIGFGPKLFGWTRNGIQYAWRLIPAGGFVALPQMGSSESEPDKQKEPLPPVSAGSKILVAVAGPIMNMLFGFVLASVIYFAGLPVLVNPAIIGAIDPASPEAKLGIQAGDRIVAVDGQPVHSWDEVQMKAAIAPTNVLPVTIEHQGVKRTYYLHTKLNEYIGLKMFDLEPSARPVIQEVLPGSPAEQAGLKAHDEIISFAQVPVAGEQQLLHLIGKRPTEAVPIEVIRNARHLQLTVTPRFDPTAKKSVLGILVAPNATMVYRVQRPGPPPWQTIGQVCGQTFATINALIHWRQTGVQPKDLSGPPGILALLAVEVKTDVRLALKFMVLLNVSLAIFNLLPIPVLDGGHIAVAIAEKIRGRPLSARLQGYMTAVFAAVLICFMLYVSYNDISKRFSMFKTLFNEQVKVQPGK